MNQLQPHKSVLSSALVEGTQIDVKLETFDPNNEEKIIRRFTKSFNNDNLPSQVKKNFKDINNINSIINQSPSICKINMEVGVITLVHQFIFPNGHKFQIEGDLPLDEQIIEPDPEKEEEEEKEKVEEEEEQQQPIFGEHLERIQQEVDKIHEIIKQDRIEKVEKQTIMQEVFNVINYQISELKKDVAKSKECQQQLYKKYQQIISLNDQQTKQKISIPDEVMHIFDQKVEEAQISLTEKIQKQAKNIEDLHTNSVRNHKLIQRLVQENGQLKKTIKLLEEKSKQTAEKHGFIETNLTNLTKSNEKIGKMLNSHEQEIQQVKSQLYPSSPKRQAIRISDEKMNSFLNKLSGNNVKPNPLNPLCSPKSQFNKTSTLFNVETMSIHPESAYSKQFVNHGKFITYNGLPELSTQLVGKLSISVQRLSFISIVNTKANNIGFGIVHKKHILERNSLKSKNCIMLFGLNGALYDGGVYIAKYGNGFKQGDSIKMRVNPVQGFIQWVINGKEICKYMSSKFKEEEIAWLPFVRMSDQADTVRWTLEQDD